MSKLPFVLKKFVCNRYITVVNIISHDSEDVEIEHLAVVFLLLQRDFSTELSKVARFIKMPEFRKDAIPPLSQDFFESLDRVDESALARLIVELNINRLQELPDLRTMFLQRRRQQLAYAHQLNRSFPGSGRAVMPQTQRPTSLQGRPWPVYV